MNIESTDQTHHYKVHLQHNHLNVVEEAGEDIILEEEEEFFPKEDAAVVLQMSLVEDRIRTPVIQVVTGFISQKYIVITTRNLFIAHINAGRSSMTKEGKSRTSRRTLALHRAQC